MPGLAHSTAGAGPLVDGALGSRLGSAATGAATMIRFQRYELRTTDVAAARAFYAAVLGDVEVEIVPLPGEAIARGAPAHWLGHLGVDDVERAASAFVERGAIRLGPTRPTAGGDVAILRDPGGAVVALASAQARLPARAGVTWHVLETTGLDRAAASYCGLFGWRLTERVDLGTLGVVQPFAWEAGGPSVGAMADVAGRPGVHPHWLFFFRVAALEPALLAVRAAGGVVLGPTMLPGGERIAVCEDPQGAAFALRE
ncbi:VOC family protein [Anaeromyxobacter oryzae]|uniref:Glyoxalase n=1 Tax=Anaeromyxobacter oryzae TaxID=2918170 RepID=A0ABN6MY58_9BACT|nr:VOC family protein [Anaeromyxobacter oryzae]BDG04739.1 glyoxalase [Anaeromyxobacter oryzae]